MWNLQKALYGCVQYVDACAKLLDVFAFAVRT